MKTYFTLWVLLFRVFFADAQIQVCEYFWDNDPGLGNGISIAVINSGNDVVVSANLPIPNLSAGMHALCIRCKTPTGPGIFENRWSVVEKKGILILPASASNNGINQINGLEYFLDTDPGIGLATQKPITLNSDNLASTSITVPDLSEGFHYLCIRAKTGTGIFSSVVYQPIIINKGGINTGSINSINKLEYFVDSDPGLGKAIQRSINLDNQNLAITDITTPNNLTNGIHILGIRVQSGSGAWSSNFIIPLIIFNSIEVGSSITQVEYYLDNDPGIGLGVPMTITSSSSLGVQAFKQIDLSGLSLGLHTLNIRAKDNLGQWSVLKIHPFEISCQSGVVLFSIQSGNWTNPLSWACGKVPSISDKVYIKNGHTITLESGQSGNARFIDSENGAILNIKMGAILKIN